jgi:CBS domain-containing protein
MSTRRPVATISLNPTKEDPVNVSDLMSTDVVTTTPAAPLRDVARMLVEHRISGMPVCDDAGAVVGVVSEEDILFKERGQVETRDGFLGWLLDSPLESELEKTRARTAGEAMTSPAVTAAPFESTAAAARRMIDMGVNRLPVVTIDGRLVGILTRADLIRAFVRPDHVIAAEIRDDVLRRVLWLEPGAIHIDVRDGEVDLAGELDTEAEAHALEKLVGKVPGVVTVRSSVTARAEQAAARR